MKNIFLFTLGKYFNYLLLFIRGVLLSLVLDVSSYAKWGIVMYILAYYTLFWFGIPNIVLTKLKDYELGSKQSSLMAGSSFVFVFIISLIYLPIIILSDYFNFFDKNELNYYVVFLIIILSVLNEISRNIARYNNHYLSIWLSDFFSIIPLIILLLLVPEYFTVNYAIWTLAFSSLLSFLILISKIKFLIDPEDFNPYLKLIYSIGVPLLIFNFSSYLLLIIVRYFLLQNYDDIVIANFNFGWLITNSIFLGLNVINWYLYPTLLKNLTNNTIKSPKRINHTQFLLFQVLFSFIIIIFLPPLFEFIIENFYTKYPESIIHFKYLLITQFIFYFTFYSSTYLVIMKKNKTLILSGFFASVFFVIGIFLTLNVFGEVRLTWLYYLLLSSALLFFTLLYINSITEGNILIIALSIICFISYGLVNNLLLKIILSLIFFVITIRLHKIIKTLINKIKYELNNI